jgi:hemerythrin-like domain-containing protein
MPKIIDILLDEHQNIEKLLLVSEHELEVFDRSGRPDYEILQSIIQYFQDYPESCHHPKEEMIFEKLMAISFVGSGLLSRQRRAERLRPNGRKQFARDVS